MHIFVSLISTVGLPLENKRTNTSAVPYLTLADSPTIRTILNLCFQRSNQAVLFANASISPPTDIDPSFGVEYDELLHDAIMCTELDVSHPTPPQQTVLTDLIKKYWRVFSKEDVTTPVKD